MLIKGTKEVSNVYILKRFDSVILIDPSYNLETILEQIKGYKLLGVLLTHADSDHMHLIGKFDCPIYLHREDYQLFLNDNLNGYKESQIKKSYKNDELFIRFVNDGDLIPLMDKNIKVIHTPGHTHGSVSYYIDDTLYTGDTLLKDEIGKSNYSHASIGKLRRSIIKIFKLPLKTKIYPGHGEITTLREERYKPHIKAILK